MRKTEHSRRGNLRERYSSKINEKGGKRQANWHRRLRNLRWMMLLHKHVWKIVHYNDFYELPFLSFHKAIDIAVINIPYISLVWRIRVWRQRKVVSTSCSRRAGPRSLHLRVTGGGLRDGPHGEPRPPCVCTALSLRSYIFSYNNEKDSVYASRRIHSLYVYQIQKIFSFNILVSLLII